MVEEGGVATIGKGFKAWLGGGVKGVKLGGADDLGGVNPVVEELGAGKIGSED